MFDDLVDDGFNFEKGLTDETSTYMLGQDASISTQNSTTLQDSSSNQDTYLMPISVPATKPKQNLV